MIFTGKFVHTHTHTHTHTYIYSVREDIGNLTFVTDTPATSASTIKHASLSGENKTTERLAFRLNFLQDKNEDLSHINHYREEFFYLLIDSPNMKNKKKFMKC